MHAEQSRRLPFFLLHSMSNFSHKILWDVEIIRRRWEPNTIIKLPFVISLNSEQKICRFHRVNLTQQMDFLSSFVTGQHDCLNCLNFFISWGGEDKNVIIEILHSLTRHGTKLGCYMIAWLMTYQTDGCDWFLYLFGFLSMLGYIWVHSFALNLVL